MKKVAIRYYTKTGNMKKLAEAISSVVGEKAEEVSVPLAEKVDILFLGSAPYAWGIDEAVKNFLKENKDKIGMIYNFSSAAQIKSTYKYVLKEANVLNIAMAEEEFYCRGKFLMMHKDHPNQEDLERIKAFTKQIIEKCS